MLERKLGALGAGFLAFGLELNSNFNMVVVSVSLFVVVSIQHRGNKARKSYRLVSYYSV